MRTRARVQVRVKSVGGDKPVTGFTRDISREGLFIQTRTPLRPGTRVEIELLYKDAAVELEGVVVRAARVPYHLQAIQASGMGVKVVSSSGAAGALEPPTAEAGPEAVATQEADETSASKSRHARVTVGAEVQVSFGDEQHRLALHDLSASGAALVSTSELPDATSVTLHLPLAAGADSVEIKGVPVRYRRLGEATVLAVRFLDVSDAAAARIQAFVRAASATGTSRKHQ